MDEPQTTGEPATGALVGHRSGGPYAGAPRTRGSSTGSDAGGGRAQQADATDAVVPQEEHSSAELEELMSGVAFPATREQLLDHAHRLGAPEEVLEGLRNIEPVLYEGPHAVSAAFTFLGDTTITYGHVTAYDQ